MSNPIIDAHNRFRDTKASKPSADVVEQQWKERPLRQEREAAVLRKELSSIARLEVSDRKILVRNLGRAIERKHGRKPTQTVSQLFRILYGEEGGASKEKKRKRYIRFDGEALKDHGPGEEYAANGREFLRLIEGLADLLDPDLPHNLARNRMLLFVCDGASFYGPSRPRLQQNVSLFENFQQTIVLLIDRIVRETDILEYLDDVRNYTIQTYPSTQWDCSPDVINNLHKQAFPVERFKYQPDGGDASYDEYSRLHLGGFDIHAEEASPLYPRLRLARIFLPRQVLCLPASVPTSSLTDIIHRDLSEAEIAEALRLFGSSSTPDELYEKAKDQAIGNWLDLQEYEMWRGAIRDADFDPDNMDWTSFENEGDRAALKGAEWRTFWQTLSVDLHLVADGHPDALHFGLSFGGGIHAHWTHAPRDLLKPSNDDSYSADPLGNCVVFDEGLKWVPWFPAGDRMLVCRGFSHNNDDMIDEYDQFEDPIPEYLDGLLGGRPLPLQEPQAWELLTMRMMDWRKIHHSPRGSSRRDANIMPCLRPLFDAPNGWAPAPDGSLASAILRSLAYGEGRERLDNKFIAQVNNLVMCFRDMKDQLASDFEVALSHHGYTD